jgi:hypothetical protein
MPIVGVDNNRVTIMNTELLNKLQSMRDDHKQAWLAQQSLMWLSCTSRKSAEYLTAQADYTKGYEALTLAIRALLPEREIA